MRERERERVFGATLLPPLFPFTPTDSLERAPWGGLPSGRSCAVEGRKRGFCQVESLQDQMQKGLGFLGTQEREHS